MTYKSAEDLRQDFLTETGEDMGIDAARVMFDRYKEAEYQREASGGNEPPPPGELISDPVARTAAERGEHLPPGCEYGCSYGSWEHEQRLLEFERTGEW